MSSATPDVGEESTGQNSAYQDSIRQLYERINYEKAFPPYSDANYRLDRMRKLLGQLGDPQQVAPIVHIAGTKGKGSTATFLSHLFSSTGYRTGLYTSPHLVKLEERFRINNVPCSPSELVQLIDQALAASERVEAAGGGRATFFELTTAAAFLHFAQQKVAAIVLEVGLGGRLDSTNVCTPVASVITTIGLDHQAQLGSTIAAIAGEKAGIIKPRTPVLSSARHADAREVIIRKAAEEQAPLRLIDRDFRCHWQPILCGNASRPEPVEVPLDVSLDVSQEVSINKAPQATARVKFLPHYSQSMIGPSEWLLSMLGAHQADNLAVALATVDVLAEQGWRFDRNHLREAALQTSVSARLQILADSPWRIIDTAHNPDSIAATLHALKIHFPHNKRTIILGASRDKDVVGMVRLILPECERLILTQYHNNARGIPVEELALIAHSVRDEYLRARKANASDLSRVQNTAELVTSQSPTTAWNIACQHAAADELICATGSFFLAAELLASLN